MRHMERCNSIAARTGRICSNLASFLGRCYVHARRPLEEPAPKSSKDHDLGCASLRPTTCNCRKGENRRMKRKAGNMLKRQKVTVEEIKPPWVLCSGCGEPVHIQALTTNEHECKKNKPNIVEALSSPERCGCGLVHDGGPRLYCPGIRDNG